MVIAPLLAVGAVILLGRRPPRGGVLAPAGVLLFLWAGMQSSALSDRFLVWLMPGAAYLVAVAVGRFPAAALLGIAWTALALTMVLPGYTTDPTAHRQAAALLQQVDASGVRGCVVNIGVPPRLGYLDAPRQFTAVTDPGGLHRCDVVVVAAWWNTTKTWFAADNRVIAAAEREFAHRTVLGVADPALVLSDRPLSGFTG
ncbi:MAG: hypothetical protein H0T70_02850 [Acidimicrobiia bacterium]|nr:hypothetical protein [Acidimicrobiia bacterium]